MESSNTVALGGWAGLLGSRCRRLYAHLQSLMYGHLNWGLDGRLSEIRRAHENDKPVLHANVVKFVERHCVPVNRSRSAIWQQLRRARATTHDMLSKNDSTRHSLVAAHPASDESVSCICTRDQSRGPASVLFLKPLVSHPHPSS